MRRVFIVSALLPVLLSSTFARQVDQPVVERRGVPGAVADVQGSPVQLAEPKYTVEPAREPPDKLQISGGEVSVTNTSGRDIRELYLECSFRVDACSGGVEMGSAVDQLRAGETRVAQVKVTVRGGVDSMRWTLTVTPTGAKFADGTYWAAPRDNRRPLLKQYLSQPDSYLKVRKFQWTDRAYQAHLQVDSAQVVAYRLGIVKDTADNFEVRLGDWVELNDEQTNRRVMFTDEANSLKAEQVFPREAYRWPGSPEDRFINWGGVATFVAELRFADGRTWRQDLTRDALFWCN